MEGRTAPRLPPCNFIFTLPSSLYPVGSVTKKGCRFKSRLLPCSHVKMCTNSEVDNQVEPLHPLISRPAFHHFYIKTNRYSNYNSKPDIHNLMESDILKSIRHDGKIFLFKHILNCRRELAGCQVSHTDALGWGRTTSSVSCFHA